MTSTALERVPFEQIGERARHARPGRTLATVLAGVLFSIGWLAAKAFSVAWLAFTWCWAAVSVGWEAAHGPSRSQQIASLTAEVEGLREAVTRLGG